MRGKILLVFLAILGLTQASYPTRCGQNEVFSKCGNNDCQKTCANPSPPSNCNNKCRAGCICKPGYLRNTIGHCVVPAECDTCSANQTFSACGNGGCQNTCTDPILSTLCDPLPGCFPGCICKEGFLLNSDGDCVEPFDCDNCGGDTNKVFYGCGNICPVTCYNKDRPIACPAICKIPGECGCRPGLVQDVNGKCINPSDCPTCGPNEFYDCGSACDTECATLGETCPIVNVKCEEKCYCKEGYARDKNNVCIPIDQCPPKCGPNEIFACGSACDTECATLGEVCPIVNIRCNDKCYCKDGYARDKNNVCIPIKKCPPKPTPKPKCPVNEVWSTTCPVCPEQCDNIGKSRCKTTKHGCACVSGYVREKKGGKCIKKSSCKKY